MGLYVSPIVLCLLILQLPVLEKKPLISVDLIETLQLQTVDYVPQQE